MATKTTKNTKSKENNENKTNNMTDTNTNNTPALMTTPDFGVMSPEDMAEYYELAAKNVQAGVDYGFSEGQTNNYLKILSNNSREVLAGSEKYVAGAKPGMIFNSANREAAEKVVIVPCFYRRFYQEVDTSGESDRNVGEVDLDYSAYWDLPQNPNKASSRLLPNGNSCVETGLLNCLLIDAATGDATETEIKFTSTNLSVAREFMKKVDRHKMKLPNGRSVPAHGYSYAYECSTKYNENKRGTWYTWFFENPVPLPLGFLSLARDYAEACSFGAVSVKAEAANVEAPSKKADISAGLAGMNNNNNSDMPF